MKLLYLCNFGSSRSEISSCSIPVSLISNATNLTDIGLFKKMLCPISHDDLVRNWFSRVNLYRVPHVTVLTFGLENDIIKTKVRAFFSHFLENSNLMLREKVMMIFPRSPVWDIIREFAKTLTSLNHILKNIARQDLKFGLEVHQEIGSNGF